MGNRIVEPGAKLGRYIVLERIGKGGMGVVYAAYDPKLDRKVALKLLRGSERWGSSLGDGQVRLVREAQAMARLAHPNVIPVYDVGVLDEQVFVAMEFVEGSTLSAWRRAEPRSWREQIDALIKAGRGLAAAHAAGLVHRDFKPDNVLVGVDGRVRVLDFGLAGPAGATGGSAAATPPAPQQRDWALTETGVVLGTPAYMPPEQHRGETIDHRSDQFAFCVSGWELLFGKRPYSGATQQELFENKCAEAIDDVGDTDVPARLRKALARGLAHAPSDRWPTMDALLETLAHDPTARARTRTLAGGVAVLSLGAIAIVVQRGAAHASSCAETAQLDGVWDENRRVAIQEAFASSGLPYAQDSWERVVSQLDEYAAAWGAAYAGVCGDVSGLARSGASTDLKMVCLRRRRSELDALGIVLMEADAKSVESSTSAASSLRPVEACDDAAQLAAGFEPPPDAATADRVEQLRERLIQAAAYHNSSRNKEALAIAQTLTEEAEQVGYAPLHAEALRLLADLTEDRGKYALAEEIGLRSFWVATSSKHDEVAARAAIDLIYVIGFRQARHEEALTWTEHARAAIARLGNPTHYQAQLESNLASVINATGHYALAAEHVEQSIEFWRESVGENHPSFAAALNNLGDVLSRLGRHQDALDRYAHALDVAEAVYGPDHPFTSSILGNMAATLYRVGRHEDAFASQERTLAAHTRTLGEDHPWTAQARLNLGRIELSRGHLEEAERHSLQALRGLTVAYGVMHPLIATTCMNLGVIVKRMDRDSDAIIYYQRAAAIHERVLGPAHPEVGLVLFNIGNLHDKAGRHHAALEHHIRAAAVVEAALGQRHEYVARAVGAAGGDYGDLGEPRRALPLLERAVFLYEQEEDPVHLALSRFNLADSLWKVGSRKRAKDLARLALSALESRVSADVSDDLTKLRTWMDERGIARPGQTVDVAVTE